MGGAADPRASFDQVVLDPKYAEQLRQASGGLFDQTQQYAQQARQAATGVNTNFQQYSPNLQTGFQQYNPQLNTNFQATPELDARAQALLSQGRAQQGAQLTSQNAQLSQQFASQPGVLATLQAQARNTSTMNANPLLFQAAQDQYGRQVAGQQLQNQAQLQQAQQGAATQQLGNQAQLQQTEAGASLAGASNQAQAQKLGFEAQPLNSQQNLLSILSSLGQLYGSRLSSPFTPSATASLGQSYLGNNFPGLASAQPSWTYPGGSGYTNGLQPAYSPIPGVSTAPKPLATAPST